MPMLGVILTPHPPVLLPEVGEGQVPEIAPTGNAIETATREVACRNSDVLIVASPHTILYRDYFHIEPGSGASGSIAAFGAHQMQIRVDYATRLQEEIIRRAESASLRAGTLGQHQGLHLQRAAGGV